MHGFLTRCLTTQLLFLFHICISSHCTEAKWNRTSWYGQTNIKHNPWSHLALLNNWVKSQFPLQVYGIG